MITISMQPEVVSSLSLHDIGLFVLVTKQLLELIESLSRYSHVTSKLNKLKTMLTNKLRVLSERCLNVYTIIASVIENFGFEMNALQLKRRI